MTRAMAPASGPRRSDLAPSLLADSHLLLEQLLGSHADVGAHVEGAAVDEEHDRKKGLVTDVSRFL